ncbi:hypothetical protein RN001_003581 [Aquatica leii]|uniref:Molybdenum cofactor sulfurase n=1 Tax=Aquatica leii TaxID=1421715 RepID=A0AAN7ST20_9COLE|nr:hypothetical protein RN001_003581 [Aquatica leii]
MSLYNPVYTKEQEALIRSEFLRLGDQCYLEHAGSTLYSERQIQNTLTDLTLNTYGNPHASNTSSKLTEDAIDQIRYYVLEHFNTQLSEYSVIFTSGATAALKLVAETFQYENNDDCGIFTYLQDNHTSALGMREYAKNSLPITPKEAFSMFSQKNRQIDDITNSNSLFVYPAQCNFSGTKYPLAWIDKAHQGILNNIKLQNPSKWFCMLDAASYASTSFLDLSKYKPDFVCLSFYKIFGHPTGLGALLVKNSSAYVLKKKYFGGGTVLMALSSERVHVPRITLHEYFEDGTLSFLSVLAVKHGFDTLRRFSLSMHAISKHTFNLARYVYNNLKTLQHQNGLPVVILYHDNDFERIHDQGGIVNFNLLRPNGEYVGYAEVLHIANLFNIHLRTGCFCNPGACQRHLNLTTEDVKHHFQSGHVCGDKNDLIDGYPTGSVRISFGYMSNKKDADDFLLMIEECFVSESTARSPCRFIPENKRNSISEKATLHKSYKGVLEQIFLYPVKSCGAFNPGTNWEIINTGFKYDRQWMIVNSAGVCVTQKNNTRLCLIKPKINLERNTLELHCEGFSKVTLSLRSNSNDVNHTSSLRCQSKVCGDQVQGWDCGDDVGTWLSTILDTPGLRLIKQCNDLNNKRRNTTDGERLLSLSNQAQFLLINTASIQWLSDCDALNSLNVQDLIYRFRPNFVVRFHEPLVENKCKQVQIGNFFFNCDAQCIRCQMVCINQTTGEKSPEPLKTLSKLFNGKIRFGIYLSNVNVTEKNSIHLRENVVLYT